MALTRTYLDECLKDGLTVRWPDGAMPIKVYVAPFKWYEKSKQQESFVYNKMVLEALNLWSNISNGGIQFQLVQTVSQSQIDINWRRVDRKSLGHCEYLINQASAMYSCEIKIGISDGLIHAQYNDFGEVEHTIIHELGHALGLIGHSKGSEDIMYVPHQYGVTGLSKRDIETVRWLYKLPVGFSYETEAQKYNLPPGFTIHDVIDSMAGLTPQIKSKTVSKKPPEKSYREKPEILLEHHDILEQMGKFHMSTQNILNRDPSKKSENNQPENDS